MQFINKMVSILNCSMLQHKQYDYYCQRINLYMKQFINIFRQIINISF
jgi:hypothetical protein